MSTLTLGDILARVESLPRLPDTAQRLAVIVADPRSTLQQIVEVIRYDPLLTAEVLRLCNSAYFGLERRIECLENAVCLLGTVRVFQLVMAAQARALLAPPQLGYGLPPGALWLHSVAVAVAAQILGRRLRLGNSGVLFTAGLLHDFGKVVLNEFVAQEYAEIVRLVTCENRSFMEAEQELLGFTHAEVGAHLAEAWSLPEITVHCIRYHHEPLACAADDALVDAVYLADSICLMLGIGTGDDGLSYRAAPEIVERRGLNENALEMVGAETIMELRPVKALFAR